MTDRPVVIAGGGIGGLATALMLRQIGVPCVAVYEAVREMRPLSLQPCGNRPRLANRVLWMHLHQCI